MALIGNLKEIKLPSLIQLNCMERNTAKLTIENGGKYGFIYFENGQIAHAEFDPFDGDEAIYRLLALYGGRFKVENDVRPPIKSIKTSWSNLLLIGMNKLDHRQDQLENSYYKLFDRILTIKGVISISLVDRQGICLESTSNVSQTKIKKESNAAFIVLQAEKLSDVFQKLCPDYISILSGNRRYFLVQFSVHFIMIEMEKKVKSNSVLSLIKQAIGDDNY